jgi:hypothetical protein
MNYKDILLELLKADDAAAFGDWLQLHSPIERVEIMKQFKQMTMQNMFKKQDFSSAETLKKYSKSIDAYEQAILLAEELKDIAQKAQEEIDNALERMARSTRENKQHLIDSIVNNDPNAAQSKELALAIIKKEKELGIYDPDFWEVIL